MLWHWVDLVVSPVPRHPTVTLVTVQERQRIMPGTWPYENDESDLGITHEYGEDTKVDVISTFPNVDNGDGQPRTVVVRKPRP